MLTGKLSSTAIVLLLASAFCLLNGCSSTTAPAARPHSCPPPAQPDPRLMEAPIPFEEAPETATSDTDILPIVTGNNQSCRQNFERYGELQRWIRGRQP